ncbi:HAD family hydrolase [Gracilibacillus marinus]|jgi:Cof subfamily protein (haloacid dehalogenase superfamily)|uniref:HAD family hydrolase n=1 Tax=Gracilibacillus marinus TaxID=630535 RepID=A0ABV8W0S8_9BACI
MIKLFATDLDGTLLKKQNLIKDDDIHAIKSLEKLDIDFAIATGRMDRDIVEICKEMNQKAYRVSQNGAFVVDVNNSSLHAHTFDGSISKLIHEQITSLPNLVCVTTADEFYISKKNEQIKSLENFLYYPLVEGIDFADRYGEDIHVSKFMIIGETTQLVSVQIEIEAQFSQYIETYISDPTCLDIVPKGVSKADGLLRLAKQLEIEPNEIAVIGDSFNDVPMFGLTDYSFAMKDAPTEVRQKANYVVHDVKDAIHQITSLIHQ